MIKLIIIYLTLTTCLLGVDFNEYRTNKNTKKEFENKNYNKAIESLEKLVTKDPSNYKYYHNLGQAYLNLKKPEEAEKYFLQSLDLNENKENRDTELNLAATYLMQQKISKAKKLLKKLIMKNPNDLEAKHNYELAKILEKMQEQQEEQSTQSNESNNQEQEEEQEISEEREEKNQEENEEENEEEQPKNEDQEEEQEEENQLEQELNEALQKEEEEKQKRIDQAKNILETLSQREEEARKKHAQKNAIKGDVENDW